MGIYPYIQGSVERRETPVAVPKEMVPTMKLGLPRPHGVVTKFDTSLGNVERLKVPNPHNLRMPKELRLVMVPINKMYLDWGHSVEPCPNWESRVGNIAKVVKSIPWSEDF